MARVIESTGIYLLTGNRMSEYFSIYDTGETVTSAATACPNMDPVGVASTSGTNFQNVLPISAEPPLTLILPRSRTGTVWFYTSTSNKGAARPKLYTKSLTRDLKRMYSRLTLVRISIKL